MEQIADFIKKLYEYYFLKKNEIKKVTLYLGLNYSPRCGESGCKPHNYYPLFCYDGLIGDFLKAELRDVALHCSNDADKFMEPLLQEFIERGIKTYLRGDSGFSTPKL